MVLLFLLGVLMITLTIIDLVWTTIWIDGGAGLITKQLTHLLWKIISKIQKGKNLSGPLILMVVLFNWVVLLWLGWTLIFYSDFNSIINTINDQPTTWQDLIYYSGYSFFTLGSGDYAPATHFWKILTVLASGTGTLFLALGASYVISIIDAVINKRAFARNLFSLGSTPEEILSVAWNGNDFNEINSLIIDLSDHLNRLSIQHKAYPLLHFFHTKNKNEAVALAVPIFSNVLSILEYGTIKEKRPPVIVLKKANQSVDNYVDTLQSMHIDPTDEPLTLPDLDQLRRMDLPVLNDKLFKKQMNKTEDKRRKLLGLVVDDLWSEKDL